LKKKPTFFQKAHEIGVLCHIEFSVENFKFQNCSVKKSNVIASVIFQQLTTPPLNQIIYMR
jgi:hypothetical protein